MTRVFKFGGALMQDATGIRKVASIIKSYMNDNLVVVVSALGKTTNHLEGILQLSFDKKNSERNVAIKDLHQKHNQIIELLFEDSQDCLKKLSDLFNKLDQELKNLDTDLYAAYDRIVSFGEKFSTLILNEFLLSEHLPCQMIDARSMIKTDNNYTSAKVDWQHTTENVQTQLTHIFQHGKFVLTEGFIGSDDGGNPTTLGREGSDFTAAILANTLDADEVTIWKNVPGLMNADPNRFNNSIKLEQISYHEAIELAFYGASVIHPKTIQPLQQKSIPLFVRSFDYPDAKASIILNDTSMDDKIHKIIIKDNQVLLSINSPDLAFIAEDHLTSIFKTFSRHKVHINLMQHSAVSFSVCFDNHKNKLHALLNDMKNEFIIKYNDDLQLITIRHYTKEIITELLENRQVFLEQKSRTTVQLLVK